MMYSPDFKELSPDNSVENNQRAFSVAEKHLGISSLIKPTEMEQPDRLALVTYLSLFYELFQDSQPATLPTGPEHDVKVSSLKEPTPSKEAASSCEKSSISPKKSAASTSKTAISTEKPVSPVEKPVTSAQKPVTSTRKQVTSAEKTLTSFEKPSEKQVISAKKPATSAEKKIASVEKPAGKQVTSEKQVVSTEKPATSTKEQITSPEKPVESPGKKKKHKRKLGIFRRSKKKTLATATPSVERYLVYCMYF